MRRWAFHLAAATSLGMFLATAALWVRSYFRAEGLHAERTRAIAYLRSGRGGMEFDYCRLPPSVQLKDGPVKYDREADAEWSVPRQFLMTHWRLPGIRYTHNQSGVTRGSLLLESWRVRVAYIYFASGFALPPLLWHRWMKRRKEARRGKCFVRGYDLRATPDRCPECGTEETAGAES